MRNEKNKLYVWLFGINLFISAFTFGGGYIVIPMIQKYFVDKKHLLTQDELLNLAAIAQSSPGAIAINLASLTAYHVAGISGLIISSISSVLPPLILLSIISKGYSSFAENIFVAGSLKGMQAAVAALIVDLIITMTKRILAQRSLLLSLLIPFSFLANFVWQINVVSILLISCLCCILTVWWETFRKNKEETHEF